jgi:uncharacterized protein YjiS (DUF1127 family)
MKIGVLSHPDFVRDSMRRAAIARFLSRLPAEIETRNEIAARYAALSTLSDAELGELGLARGDIPRVAVLGADA